MVFALFEPISWSKLVNFMLNAFTASDWNKMRNAKLASDCCGRRGLATFDIESIIIDTDSHLTRTHGRKCVESDCRRVFFLSFGYLFVEERKALKWLAGVKSNMLARQVYNGIRSICISWNASTVTEGEGGRTSPSSRRRKKPRISVSFHAWRSAKATKTSGSLSFMNDSWIPSREFGCALVIASDECVWNVKTTAAMTSEWCRVSNRNAKKLVRNECKEMTSSAFLCV